MKFHTNIDGFVDPLDDPFKQLTVEFLTENIAGIHSFGDIQFRDYSLRFGSYCSFS